MLGFSSLVLDSSKFCGALHLGFKLVEVLLKKKEYKKLLLLKFDF